MPPLGLSDEELSTINSLVQPLPYTARNDFLHQLIAELSTAGGPRSPGLVRTVGQRLQIRYLGVSAVGPDDHHHAWRGRS